VEVGGDEKKQNINKFMKTAEELLGRRKKKKEVGEKMRGSN
jgi:hypothetical protein